MSEAPIIFGEVLFDCFGDDCVLGGAPFNVAWHLQGFGVEPRFVSRVGADELGEEVRSRMRDWGMDERWLQADAERPTGRVRVHLSEGQPSYAILDDQAYDAIEPPDGLEITTDTVLYHGSLAARHARSRETLEGLRRNANVFVDVNLRTPWWDAQRVADMAQGAKWLKLNNEEYALLARPGEAPEAFVRRLSLGSMVLTRGADGAEIYTDDERYSAAVPSVTDLVDAVGAGDAFSAVTLYGIGAAWPWELTLRRATEFAARVCGWRGALCHDRAIYEEVLRDWRGI